MAFTAKLEQIKPLPEFSQDDNEQQAIKPFPAIWEKCFTDEELERLAIRTVDGGMTDAEVLEAEQLTAKISNQED